MDCHITLSLLCALLLTCYSAGQQSYVPYAWGQQQYEGEGYSNFEVNYIKTGESTSLNCKNTILVFV